MRISKNILIILLVGILVFSACNTQDSSSGMDNSSGGGGTQTSVPTTDSAIDGIWQDNENVIVGNGGNEPNANNPQSPTVEHLQTTNTLHKVSVKSTNRPFVVNGKSDYKVIIPSVQNSRLLTAANYFVKYIKEATGCQLAIESQENYTWTENEKWIILGRDDIFKSAGLTMPEEDIGISGYYIKSVGNSVFVAVQNDFGYKRAVLSLLDHIVGYEMYWHDTVVFEKDGSTLPEMKIIESPDFAFYQESNVLEGDGRYGMGFDENIWIRVNGTMYHNSFKCLPKSIYEEDHPKWYSINDQGTTESGTQICYNAQGDEVELQALIEETASQLLYYAKQMPNLATITFTQEDTRSWCGCKVCLSMKEKYNGSNASSAVRFINAVDNIVQAELQREADLTKTAKRKLNLVIFAYRQSEVPPVKQNEDGTYSAIDSSVICNPTVGVYVAPIEANYQNSFYSNENILARENIRGWSSICKNMYVWIYDTNFREYMFPLNSWSSKIETYRFLKENNAYYLHSQSQYDNGSVTHFSRFKDYIDAKASFDVNVNYNDLADSFFKNYYGPASAPMRQFFDELEAYMSYLAIKYPAVIVGGYKENSAQSYLWPKATLDGWLELIDKAYLSIDHLKESDFELYEKYREHILLESIFPRYALLKFYQGAYNSEVFHEMALQFKEDCATLGITKVSEGAVLTSFWKELGI